MHNRTSPRESRSPAISTITEWLARWRCSTAWGAAWLETAKAAISPTKAIPEAEIEAIIALVPLMMELMMTCRYQPAPCPPLNQGLRKHLPSHVIGNAHDRHDREHGQKGSDM